METWCNFFRQISAVSLAFFILAMLGIGMAVSDSLLEQSPVIRVTQGLAVVWLIYKTTTQFAQQPVVKLFAKCMILPIAVLYVFSWLDGITA